MKKIALILVMMCVSLSFAQDNKEKVKLKKVGDLIEATYFYTTGEIAQHGFFKNNLRHANWISYNKKGEKMVIGYYNKGKKTGKWIFKTGNTLKEVDYLNNKIIRVNQWSDKSTMAITNNK